jgi:phosphatidylserine/phosphatidylglycerophosphate/cardiolipin synthase-like enzyme
MRTPTTSAAPDRRRSFCALALLLLALTLLAGCQPTPTAAPTPRPTVAPSPTPAPPPELFILPEQGIAPVLTALQGARQSIHMVTYLMTEPKIIGALKDAVGRGVDTRLILELNPYGGGSGNVDVGADLAKAGVKLKWDNPAFVYTHAKFIVIDGKRLLLMTGNMTSSTFSANREYGVIDSDMRDVTEALGVFEADWNRAKVDLSQSRLVWGPDNSRQRILQMFDAAQETLDIQHQDCQDGEMIAHIVGAIQRGVKVRYISSATYPLSSDVDEPGRQRLRAAGAQVRYMNDPYVHAKIFIVDRQLAFVGSQNMTANSLDFNREVGIALTDSAVLNRILTRFNADWQAGVLEAFPTGPLELPPAGYVDAKDAKRYQYREAPVQLTVAHIYNSGRVIWLMADADQDTNFKAVFFPSDYGKWPRPPDEFYNGKTIRVTGLIEIYQGWPEIIVNDPKQVHIVQ